MKLTYSIKAVLRSDKKKADGTCPIHFAVRVGPYVTRISSGKSVLPKEWDEKANNVKRTDKFNQQLSVYIASKVSGWEMFMLKQESLGKPTTLNVALAYLKGNAEITLFGFWTDQMKLWEFEKKPATLKSYRSAARVLQQFNNKLNFGDLTYDCIQKFDLFMRKERNNSTNGCFVKHKCLKHMIREAISKGLMDHSPYEHFKIRTTKGTRTFLSIEEVNLLADLKVPEKEVFLQMAKDIFLG